MSQCDTLIEAFSPPVRSMSLQTLPSPYEIVGGDNPFYEPAGNIAGLSGEHLPLVADLTDDYGRYMQPAAPFLAGYEDEVFNNWPVAVVSAAYGYTQSGASGLLLGILGGYYLPRATPVAIALHALFSHESVRDSALRYIRR